jgi:hypothetical protein
MSPTGGGERDYKDVLGHHNAAGVSAAVAAVTAIHAPPHPCSVFIHPHFPAQFHPSITCRYTAFSESWVTAYCISKLFIDECEYFLFTRIKIISAASHLNH